MLQVRDLTVEEENSEEGIQGIHSKRNGGKKDLVKFLKEGITLVTFLKNVICIISSSTKTIQDDYLALVF